MPMPRYSRADFRSALQALLPRGRVWPREDGSAQARVLDGLAGVYERQSADAAALLADAFPPTAQDLLPEWEATLGLDGGATMPERRFAVIARLTARGGQSHPYFIGLAEALGFPGATITDFGRFTVGGACTAAVRTGSWHHVWLLHVPDDGGLRRFTAGSACTHAVRAWGRPLLERAVRRVQPAHTLVRFGYGAPDPVEAPRVPRLAATVLATRSGALLAAKGGALLTVKE